MTKEHSSGAVVFCRGKNGVEYLLLHYGAGHWDFPKGHIKKKESNEMAALREITEETGLTDIEMSGGFKEKIQYFYKKNEDTVFKEVVFFLAETRETGIRLSSEHIDYVWMSFQNALKRLDYKNSKGVLTKANKFLINCCIMKDTNN